MNWLISVPVWGEPYTTKWKTQGLPAVQAALDYAGRPPHRFLIHDKQPRGSMFGDNSAIRLATCDKIAIETAELDEAIMLINSDMVVSREVFKSCRRAFKEGATFVSCPSIRTTEAIPPIGVSASHLFIWSWTNRHIFTEDCVWERGQCALPPYVIFQDHGNIVMHAFDLQPLAIHKTRQMEYSGPTASEILSMFTPEATFVPLSGEMLIAEPAGELIYDRSSAPFGQHEIIRVMRDFCFTQAQHQQFHRQIVLAGGKNDTAQYIADRLVTGTHNKRLDMVKRIPRPICNLVPNPIREQIARWIDA